MIRTLLYRPSTGALQAGGEELLEVWRGEPDSVIWANFFEEPNEAESTLLQDCFGLHPLAISDAQRNRHPPKLERFDDHLFLLVRGLTGDTPTLESSIVQIAMFLAPRFLVTRHSRPSPGVAAIFEQVSANPALFAQSPAHIAGLIARRIADRYFKILMDIETRLDVLEDDIFARPDDSKLEELIGFRTSLEKYRRVFNYHVLAFDSIRRDYPEFFPQDLEPQYTDVYEQFDRENSLAGVLYGVCSDLMDGYISVASHRLNNIVKILTIVTTIFVPLGFLAGIYGMNFDYMPELKSQSGYFILLSVMGFIAVMALLVFRRIRWL